MMARDDIEDATDVNFFFNASSDLQNDQQRFENWGGKFLTYIASGGIIVFFLFPDILNSVKIIALLTRIAAIRASANMVGASVAVQKEEVLTARNAAFDVDESSSNKASKDDDDDEYLRLWIPTSANESPHLCSLTHVCMLVCQAWCQLFVSLAVAECKLVQPLEPQHSP